MKQGSPFSHRPDRELGEALKDALTPSGHRAFVEEVLRQARPMLTRPHSESSWDVLGQWARPGLAVAMVAFGLLLVGYRAITHQPEDMFVSLDDQVERAANATERTPLTSQEPPNVDVVLASLVEN